MRAWTSCGTSSRAYYVAAQFGTTDLGPVGGQNGVGRQERRGLFGCSGADYRCVSGLRHCYVNPLLSGSCKALGSEKLLVPAPDLG